MTRKVTIQYGVFAGHHTGKKLRKALQAAGYHITDRTDDADIIIAHSAGCFWLPEPSAAQQVVLIDPPYWPGKSVRVRARSRYFRNLRFHSYGYPLRYWLIRNLWGAYYGVFDWKQTRRITRFAPSYNLAVIVRDYPNILLVRNEHDDWLAPDLSEVMRANPRLVVHRLPGDHDDINYHPERYVALLKAL